MTEPSIDEAVAVLRAGGVVGLPTETVYGLAADATDPEAVARVFRVKGRPADHPLIVHVGSVEALGEVAVVDARARALVARFWPGPLTLVLPRQPSVLDAVTGGRDSVAVRMPAHPVALAVLRAFGRPLVAPSANRFGRVSPTTAAHVRADLSDDVPCVLDGGACEVGVESTIVELVGDRPTVLRAGAITAGALAEALGVDVAARASGPSRAPGMLASHYAPRAEVRLVEAGQAARRAADDRARGIRAGALAPGVTDAADFVLPADAVDAARVLYGMLRDADARGVDVLYAELPEDVGLGVAVADRLRRAAHPSRASRD